MDPNPETDAPGAEPVADLVNGGGNRPGFGVQDLPNPGVAASVRRAVALLPPGQSRLLVAAAIIQASLGLLDLLGVALIGLLAAIAVSAVGVSELPSQVDSLLNFFGMGDMTVTQKTVIVAVVAVTVLVGKTALSALMAGRILRFLANRQADVSVRLAREFLSRPLIDVQRWTTSEAIYALGGGVGAATVALLGASIIIASEMFLFLILGTTLILFDPSLTLVALAVFTGIVLFLHRVLGRWSARNAQIMTDSSIDTLTAVSEALSTYRETTVLNRRELYVERYEGIVTRNAVASASTAFILEIPKYVLEATLYLTVTMLAVFQFLTKDLGAAAATVALFLAAGSRLVPAMLRFQGAGITIRNASIQAQPTFVMADFLASTRTADSASQETIPVRETALQIRHRIAEGHGDFSASISVHGATLTYLDARAPALRDATFSALPGTSVALVGPTGAGKSTLADVILGVLEPQIGEVLISGVSPKDAVRQWPGAIAYIPQNVALIQGAVRENVALGLPRAAIDDDLVWEALHRAHLADFLRDSREGLDTSIGERGIRLSGGQRQRLGIARALYTRPLLLLLDEATSSLDAETEKDIIDTLKELEGKVTTVTVAHRLATVRLADQVLYLNNGAIIARGTFEEVRAKVADFDRQAALLGL